MTFEGKYCYIFHSSSVSWVWIGEAEIHFAVQGKNIIRDVCKNKFRDNDNPRNVKNHFSEHRVITEQCVTLSALEQQISTYLLAVWALALTPVYQQGQVIHNCDSTTIRILVMH